MRRAKLRSKRYHKEDEKKKTLHDRGAYLDIFFHLNGFHAEQWIIVYEMCSRNETMTEVLD